MCTVHGCLSLAPASVRHDTLSVRPSVPRDAMTPPTASGPCPHPGSSGGLKTTRMRAGIGGGATNRSPSAAAGLSCPKNLQRRHWGASVSPTEPRWWHSRSPHRPQRHLHSLSRPCCRQHRCSPHRPLPRPWICPTSPCRPGWGPQSRGRRGVA